MKKFIIKKIISWMMSNIDIKRETFQILDGKQELILINLKSWKMKSEKWNMITLNFWVKKNRKNKRDLAAAYLNGELKDISLTTSNKLTEEYIKKLKNKG